jgi:uncharacterized protein YdhG (YjbR/CyaY superfamily)
MAKKQATGVAEEVAAYLSAAPAGSQARHALVRAEVLAQAGEGRVSERLSYGVPAFFVDGKVLLYVGLWTDHLAVYPVPESATDPGLDDDLAPHRKGKGTLHFPYAQDWPGPLIARLVAAHLERLA